MTLPSPAATFVRDRFTWVAYFLLSYFTYLQGSLGPSMPFLRDELKLSYTVGALHLSAFALGMILAGLTGDRLSHRYGRQITFWGGGVGMAAGALLLALGRHVVLTVASSLVMGYLGALLLVTIQASLSDRHGERRAIAFTESNMVATLGSGLAPLCVGLSQRAGVGWRGALLLPVVLMPLVAARFYHEPVPAAGAPAEGLTPSGGALPASFWAYWALVVTSVSIEWCLVFWGASFLENVVGFDKVAASTLMSVFYLAALVGRIAGSWLTRTVGSLRLLLAAIGTTAAGFPFFWLAPVAALNVAGLFVAGLGVANLFPLTLSLAVGVAPRQSSAASARVTLGAGTAILCAPLILGWVADRVGIRTAYGTVVVLLAMAVAMALLANRLAASRQAVAARVDSQ